MEQFADSFKKLTDRYMDPDMILIIAAVLMCIACIALLAMKRKQRKYDEMFDDLQEEAVATLSKVEDDLQEEKTELLNRAKRNYEEKLEEFKEYTHCMESLAKTPSEARTHHILEEIKRELTESGAIEPRQMKIMANVFNPARNEKGDMMTVKADHLVLFKTGIYVMDTIDHLEGTILHGVSKERTSQFRYILEQLYPAAALDEEKTILKTTGKSNSEITFIPAGNPSQDVMAAENMIQSLIGNDLDHNLVTPLIYFGHHHELVNYSQKRLPFLFDSNHNLKQFFEEELRGSNHVLSEEGLEEIKRTIEKARMD